MSKKTKILLKDLLYNKEKLSHIIRNISRVYADFDAIGFERDVLKAFPALELKDRMYCISGQLQHYLPSDYPTALGILLESLVDSEPTELFMYASYSDFVEQYGCTTEYVDISLAALGEFTKFASAEFAIRKFLNEFPKKTFAICTVWAKSPNVHQRRLVSEGLRPKLPWASGISISISDGAAYLDLLYTDTERYVTRSVANHLNDISKTDPDQVVTILKRWKKSGAQEPKEMEYIIEHALRTSKKRGHVGTLTFLGYSISPDISVSPITIDKDHIKLGESINFSFDVTANRDEDLMIDYTVIYPTPHKKQSKKVFKIKKATLKKGETISTTKKQTFRQMTTKKLYAGIYTIELQINGQAYTSSTFRLET